MPRRSEDQHARDAALFARAASQHVLSPLSRRSATDGRVNGCTAIEYQGWDSHRSRSAFDADYRRDRLLTLAGWSIPYFTSASSDAEIVHAIQRLRGSSPRR